MPRRRNPDAPPHPADNRSDPHGFGVMLSRFLQALAVTKYSPQTIHGRNKQLREFIAWAAERDLCRPADINRQHLELYRRYLHHYAKANGKPQSVLSQQVKLTAVRVFFRWLSKQNFILFNPASEIDLPRTPDRLPDLIESEDDGTLFLMRDGRAITPAALGQRVAAFVKSAKLGKTGSCHLFRHTAATLMLEGGADIRYIQAMLGHAELSTTQIYTRVSIQKLKAIHDATHPAAHLRHQGTGYGVQGSETEEQPNSLTPEP